MWLGGIVFLSFVEAPGVFSILASREQAGSIVGYSLTRLHYIGIAAAIIYFISAVALAKSAKVLVQPAAILVGLMLALTLVSEFGVRPRMNVLRPQMDSLDSAATAIGPNPARAEFDRLHRVSVQLEGATLLLGVAALFFGARRAL